MGSDDSDREAPRRHERSDRDRDRDRHKDRGDSDKDKDRRKGSDQDTDRRRERHRDSHDDDSRRRDRDDRDGRGHERRDRGDRRDKRDRDDGWRDRKDDEHRRSRPRSRDSRKRRRGEESEEHTERRRRRDRDTRDRDRDHRDRDHDRDTRGSREPREPREKKPARLDGPLPDQAAEFAMTEGGEPPPPPKEKPNWASTGALAAESNAVAQADGSVVVLKYSEPPNARKASARDEWKMFVFKDGSIVDTVDLNPRSCWLIGREASVVDLVAAHPSISGQHAVVQFRYIEKRNEFGDRIGRVKPYIIDLASANGTLLNGEPIETQRFVELRDKDMVQLGHSAREYVFMLAPKNL